MVRTSENIVVVFFEFERGAAHLPEHHKGRAFARTSARTLAGTFKIISPAVFLAAFLFLTTLLVS